MTAPKQIKRKRPATVSKDEQLAKAALADISQAKRRIAADQELVKENEALLLGFMDKREVKSITVKVGQETVTGTVVAGETVTYDDNALAKKLGAKLWNSISQRVVNKTLLGEALKSGTVDETTLASTATIVPRKPFVKVTRS